MPEGCWSFCWQVNGQILGNLRSCLNDGSLLDFVAILKAWIGTFSKFSQSKQIYAFKIATNPAFQKAIICKDAR
jgi:hypothetical protein